MTPRDYSGITLEERAELKAYLETRIEIEGDCWLWTGAMNHAKTPVFQLRRFGGGMGARTAMWLAMVGPIPRGSKLMTPLCDCRCINPAHTKRLSHKQLFAQASKNGRLAHGRKHRASTLAVNRAKPHVKLNPEIVAAMRARYAEINNAAQVAREFGISHAHAHRVCRYQWWNETNPFVM